MATEQPTFLVDAVKASASKLQGTKSALEARSRELDALKAQLDADRAEFEKRAAKLDTDRLDIERDREEARSAHASVDRELAELTERREQLSTEAARLREEAKAFEEREATVRESETRLERLEQAVVVRMTESEARLRALVEREEGLIKSQTDWLAAFEAHGKELFAITEQMRARHDESVQHHQSLADIESAFKDEMNRLQVQREELAAKEKSLLEAQRLLAGILGTAEAEPREAEPPALTPTPVPAAPIAEEPPVEAETPVPPPRVEVRAAEEARSKPAVTKTEALDRLTQAIQSWKRARDAGRDVGESRNNLKAAKGAIEAGDYETAFQIATEVLHDLQVAPLAR